MGMKDFLNEIKTKVSAIKDKIVDWIKDNKKLSFIILGLVSLMVICIILIIIISSIGKNRPGHIPDFLKLSQELVIPNGPELPRDYTISRETKEKWSEEEAEKWFTSPSKDDLNGLSKANDNMIDKILGGAP